MLDYATIMHPILVETVKRVRDLLEVKNQTFYKSFSEEELQISKVGVLPPQALPFFYHLY
jgi:hypothetical protein